MNNNIDINLSQLALFKTKLKSNYLEESSQLLKTVKASLPTSQH
jgi:hypothetical protein